MTKAKQKKFTLAEAKKIGDKLGVDWQTVDPKQFCLGMNAEYEDGVYNPISHFATDDPILIGKIVRGHLNEASDYYTRWAQIEKETKRAHSDKS